ncbi:MAG: hypothetical protein KF796_07400 [Ramlibacter sp.]|nr:hypothetical protein [Ramlibacter sp.]
MLRKLLATFGILASTAGATATPPYDPYKSDAANAIYNLLFCDDPSGFEAKSGERPSAWQLVLASNPINVSALEALAADPNQEGRVRYLAFQRLRTSGRAVPQKELLGVIVEVPLSGGLDTLAAYSEGGVRYVNQSGKLVVAEGVPSFQLLVAGLFTAAKPVVAKIGPWKGPRRAPPAQGNIRMTFLVSDGLYFGEGPMALMQQEPLAAPVIKRATELLQAVVAAGTK